MILKRLFPALFTIGAFTVLIWSCQSAKPLGPIKNVAMSVHVPQTAELKASLLGTTLNELFYRVDGPGLGASYTGTVGPFSTASNFGSVDFLLNIPSNATVLSLQLNDASTHQPLAIGAVSLSSLSSPVSDIVVEMGSVTRNCYFVNEKTGVYGGTASTYGFNGDFLTNVATKSAGTYDIGVSFDAAVTLYQIVDAQGTSQWPVRWSIAYLGNGNLVDHDVVPPNAGYFFPTSGAAKQYAVSVGSAPAAPTTDVQAGDIYYILLGSIANGQAWIQVTDPGLYIPTGGGYGPSFRFRVNSTSPYYAYQQTTADVASSCSTLW